MRNGLAQACKAADDLKANLEEEYVAVREFIVEFCRCMDYVQHAKMLVAGCAFLCQNSLVCMRPPGLKSNTHTARKSF